MSRLPHFLLAGYVVLFVICGIAPYDRPTWWAENIPIVLIVAALVATFRRFRFSNTSYVLMSVLVYLHTIGGHYTFERVPFGWVTETFEFDRNHYDRIAHFTVGFYGYAIAEFLHRRHLVRSVAVLLLFPVAVIFSVASIYEIIEWQYAATEGGKSGAAFLGSQGDIWDAQKDMLADGLGAVVAVLFYAWRHRGRLTAEVRA
jgi:putative membrane protein